MKCKFELYYVPIFTVSWLFAAIIITYIIAVLEEHVYALFPFISNCGNIPPESCVFSEMLNVGAYFECVIVYIRYKVVKLVDHRGQLAPYAIWNFWSLILGVISCIGIIIVANFQELSVPKAHYFGATLTFFIGGIYFLIQAYLTWLSYASLPLKIVRTILSSTVIPCFVTMIAFSYISTRNFTGNRLYWTSDDVAYDYHLIASIIEWAMTLFMHIIILTFIYEFRNVEFRGVSFRKV